MCTSSVLLCEVKGFGLRDETEKNGKFREPYPVRYHGIGDSRSVYFDTYTRT